MEKRSFPDIILKRDNYEERRQFILRKLNKTPLMLTWFQGNQDEEMDFTIIPFQTRVVRTQEVAEPGTGRMVDLEVEKGILIKLIWGRGLELRRYSIRACVTEKSRNPENRFNK